VNKGSNAKEGEREVECTVKTITLQVATANIGLKILSWYYIGTI